MTASRRNYSLFLLFITIYSVSFTQVIQSEPESEETEYYGVISLDEVYVLSPLQFESNTQRNQYYRLRMRVFKVFKYAVLAEDRLKTVEDRLSTLKRKGQKRAYTKRVKKFLETELTEPLKKLSRNDGKVLIRLIDRQTGYSAFDLVKTFRNGWTAFWYQTAASAYQMDLKDAYNPYENLEDYWIEDILQRAFTAGTLPYREALHPIKLALMEEIWKAN